MVVLHGAAGFADELIIVGVAFGVMWLAVRLAGRKPVQAEDELLETDAGEQDRAAASDRLK